MKQQVTVVTDLKQVLADMEPWIKKPDMLYTGRSGNFQLRPREILANWLLCAVGNGLHEDKSYTFSNDPVGGGDGIIIEQNSQDLMITEHVFASKHQLAEGKVAQELIVNAVMDKQSKGGEAYAKGKHLVVFCDGIGDWIPNRVSKEIDGKHDFSSVWAIGLQKPDGEMYSYSVVDFQKEQSPIIMVHINFQDKSWKIEQTQ